MPARITDLNDPAFGALFRDISSSWFRLETLQAYEVDYEGDEFDEFLRTGRIPDRADDSWQQMITRHVQAGRSLSRVHVIEEPLTDYLRYELAAYEINASAGEDIRLIPARRGQWPDGVPRVDFWLFDDARGWAMEYDEEGHFLVCEPVTDPEQIDQYRAWRDTALEQSITLGAYLARVE